MVDPKSEIVWKSLAMEKNMTGVEVAWRTLQRERVEEPCLIACWMMKRGFFRRYGGVQNIYGNPVQTAVEAFANAGCNLNPQFILPSPTHEHRACDPFNLPSVDQENVPLSKLLKSVTPEQVRDDVEKLPEKGTLASEFDIRGTANEYAERLLKLRQLSGNRTLYISGFGGPSFMGGYTKWSYESYLSALLLYPEHLRKYYEYSAEFAKLRNVAIVDAMERFDLAPVVYGGDDICFNDGPICSVDTLDNLYFPSLKSAIQPLVDAGIDIVWHCDGNVLPIVDRLIGMGITGFQGFQEREAGIPFEEMAKLRRADGGKLIFFGSISVVHTFPFGDEDEMKREIERCYRVAGPGGGFCLASSSSVLPETPMENITTFLEHGAEFGRRFLAGLT